MGGGVRCLFTLFRGGCNGFGLSLLLGGERGKEALTVPHSGSPDSCDPKTLWRIIANGGERSGVMVANYIAAFVPHSVSVLHSLFHGHRRHRIGEEANDDILWVKFTHRWPRRSPWAPSLPLWAVALLMMQRAEGEAEGPPPWFGRTRGSAAPSSVPLGVIFLPGAGMIGSGVVAMCTASSSTAGLAKAWLAGDCSSLSPYVDSDPMNGMMDFPAMVMVLCR